MFAGTHDARAACAVGNDFAETQVDRARRSSRRLRRTGRERTAGPWSAAQSAAETLAMRAAAHGIIRAPAFLFGAGSWLRSRASFEPGSRLPSRSGFARRTSFRLSPVRNTPGPINEVNESGSISSPVRTAEQTGYALSRWNSPRIR